MSSSYRSVLELLEQRHDAPRPTVAVYVCVTPVDMRKSGRHVGADRGADAEAHIFEPALWVFSNDRRDRIKIVYWQRNGLCL